MLPTGVGEVSSAGLRLVEERWPVDAFPAPVSFGCIRSRSDWMIFTGREENKQESREGIGERPG